jgi:hypothetical protein
MKKRIIVFALYLISPWLCVIKASETDCASLANSVYSANYTNLLNYFVLGQPTNDICVGISKLSQATAIICLFYVGETNSNRLWIAPPRFQRAEYYLYDSFGNVHEGLISPPFTMPYDEASLTNIFQIEHRGDYKLLVKGRIMKINDDSSLSIMEFPLVSLAVHIQE